MWHDARHIADHIAIQRTYLEYHDASRRRSTAHAEQDGAAPPAAPHADTQPLADAVN